MRVLSVADLTRYLRELLESDEIVRDIWVGGEISNFNRHAASGHCYFRLKGDNAVLDAVMWNRQAERLSVLPRNGDAVLAHGKVSFYEPGGKLQLYADMIQPAGVGLLHAQFEELKQRLEAEGLFELSRKRALPRLPRRVGVATAPGGAAFRDIVSVLARRCPLIDVLLAPCLVQGDAAPDSIVEALYALYAAGVDVIIVARGGGSIEDLWAFNEEVVARAVFASPVPLITGVGHETDTTIVDYIADMRAPTPSAAAELAVPDRSELAAELGALHQRLAATITDAVAGRRDQMALAAATLRRHSPLMRIARERQQVDGLLHQAERQFARGLALRRVLLQGLRAQIDTLSPQATLARGYAVVHRAADRAVITQAEQLAADDILDITLHTGHIRALVQEGTPDERR